MLYTILKACILLQCFLNDISYVCLKLNATLFVCTLKEFVRVMRHFDVTLKSKLYLYINNGGLQVNPSEVVHLLG
jgi:hypothetical protein